VKLWSDGNLRSLGCYWRRRSEEKTSEVLTNNLRCLRVAVWIQNWPNSSGGLPPGYRPPSYVGRKI